MMKFNDIFRFLRLQYNRGNLEPQTTDEAFEKSFDFLLIWRDYRKDNIQNDPRHFIINSGKKVDKQLAILRKKLAEKQPLKSQNLYQEYNYKQIYQKIDTDLESFFYKRQYNLENFNFLIKLLGEQHKIEAIPQVQKKMQILGIDPDQKTFNHFIKAAANEKNIELTEKYFKLACEKFPPNKFFYTSLMQVYVNNFEPIMAFKILQELESKGIEPDLPVYTTLINCFRKGKKLQKCWEVNRMLLKKKVPLDQTYVGVMLKVHAATHDAEKAIKLYKEQIVNKYVKPMIETKNAYFKALSGRIDYSKKVIDQFFLMIEDGQAINQETIRWALRACATSGNIKSAIEIVKVLCMLTKIMKLKQIQPTRDIYSNIISVYAKVCSLPVMEQYQQLILTDTWKVLQEVIERKMLDTTILNQVIRVYSQSMVEDKIEGLILPLYQKFGLEYDTTTFQILVEHNYNKSDFNTAVRVYEAMKAQHKQNQEKYLKIHGPYKTEMDKMKAEFRPSFNLLQTYIQMGIRLMDMNMVLQALQIFKKMKRYPKNSTLKYLGNMKNLPEQILVSLMDFQIRFGNAKLKKTKTNSERQVDDPQNK